MFYRDPTKIGSIYRNFPSELLKEREQKIFALRFSGTIFSQQKTHGKLLHQIYKRKYILIQDKSYLSFYVLFIFFATLSDKRQAFWRTHFVCQDYRLFPLF